MGCTVKLKAVGNKLIHTGYSKEKAEHIAKGVVYGDKNRLSRYTKRR